MGETMTDLLATDDDAIVTTVDFSKTVERAPRRNADGYEIGVCRVCGQEASTPSGTYCDDHKTRQKRAQTPGEGGATPGTDTVRRPATGTGRGAPKADEWSNKVFDKLVILATAVFATNMVRRNGLNDPNDAIADSLTMDADEARRVAKPIGRMMAGTKFSKTQGRKILDNSDLLDAGFALYDYMDRVNRTLRQYGHSQPLATVTPIRQPEHTVQSEYPMGGGDTTNGQTKQEAYQPGIPLDGTGLPNLTGWQYVP